MGRIFFDMDNTLAKTRQAMDTFERIYENNFFTRLSPYANTVDAVNLLIDERKTEVFFLTSYPSDASCYAQKREWIKRYCPQASLDNIITYLPDMDLTAYIPLGVLPGDVLVDDYSNNLANWNRRGGTAVKFMGDLTGISRSAEREWERFSLSHTDPASVIASGLQALSESNGIEIKGAGEMSISEIVELRAEYIASPRISTWANRNDLTKMQKALVASWLFYDDSEKGTDIKQLLAACKTIHAYEASVKRVPSGCYVDRLERRKRGISQDAVLNYAERCKRYLLFKKEVENAEDGSVLYVGETSGLLKQLGCSDYPMYYTERHLNEALQEDGKHPVPEVVMFKMPELIENPVAALRAKTVEGKERILLLLSEINANGEPYVAIIEPNGEATKDGKKIPSTFVNTFYARDQVYSELRTAAKEKTLMWYDVARLDKLLDTMGYRRPRDINRMLSGRILNKVSYPNSKAANVGEKRTLPPVKNTTQKTAAQVGAVKRGAKKI